MVFRSYIEKFNTIIKGSELNVGINPISELNYGIGVSRMLVYFDCKRLSELINSGVTPDIKKFTHVLKITNCGSMDFTDLHCGKCSDINSAMQIRATSFDVIFFLLPMDFDSGKGFDYKYNYFNQGYYKETCSQLSDSRKLLSSDGSNWFQARNNYPWKEEGVYSLDTLETEYEKYSNGEGSDIIIGRQHFDVGNEDISIDITDTVNKFLSGELENHGIGIAFTPIYERSKDVVNNYVGFFTNKTHTFFEPHLESSYCDKVSDDRANFVLDKENRLYLYCNIGGNLENLDALPTCAIDDEEYEVINQTKGCYYVNVTFKSSEYKPNTMHYDIWSNLQYNGVKLEDVENDFTTKSPNIYFNIGSNVNNTPRYVPSISGIKSNEKIYRGDIRKLVITARVPYTSNQAALVDNIKLRLYIKDGEREVDVISYDNVNKSFFENYYLLDTSMLIPQRYFVDVKMNYNMEVIEHHDLLEFTIVNEFKNKYL